ncbi:MAG: LysR family transcriptional regulator [Chromatiales bacterium]|nr:LysR family transcriptional regulator [Chromatiales bacterium]
MNLRDLRYLIAVAKYRHFGKAAEACFVSQPTLSGQIKKLEEFLGVTLFERTNRSVSITPVGEEILRHARLALEQSDMIEQVARAHRDPVAGPLRLGVIPTLSPYLMPLVLMPLRERYPQMRLILSEEITDSLMERLREHQIDVALIATPVDDPELQATPLFNEPFWLAHPRGHPLYLKDEITEEDLLGLNLLLLSDGHCLTHQVMEVCHLQERDQGGDTGDLRASSLETLLQLVGAGFGCTLVPALAIRGPWMTDAGVIARPLHLDSAFRRVSMVSRRTFPRHRALELLAQIIVERLPNTVERLLPLEGKEDKPKKKKA